MIEVVVYLDSDYSENRTIWVDRELSRYEIRYFPLSKFD